MLWVEKEDIRQKMERSQLAERDKDTGEGRERLNGQCAGWCQCPRAERAADDLVAVEHRSGRGLVGEERGRECR